MWFSETGPKFPDRLVDQLVAGEVAFLCGAGVSTPALPGFKDIVDRIYTCLGETKLAGELAAYERERYEECLGTLGRRLARLDYVADAAEESLRAPSRIRWSNHETLLRLSRDESGRPIVVTTNFDTLFERALARSIGLKKAR